MNGLYKTLIVASALSVVVASSAVAGPVEDRKELMKSVGKSVKLSVQMAKGDVPYDAAAAAAAMQTIHDVPDKFVKLFPQGSDKHPKTEASPKIWQDMNGFLAKAADLKAASAKTKAAASQGQQAFQAAVFGPLVKTCKGCHDAYRIKKN
jgi:cytochrome c556